MGSKPASEKLTTPARLILGSASPRRLAILNEIGFPPDQTVAADIDETPHKRELPGPYALRVALGKNAALAALHSDDFILTADTTVAVGRRILGKPESDAEAAAMLRLLSGRNHRVYTGVVVRAPDGRTVSRLVETRVKVKSLTDHDIAALIATAEWRGRAGGYSYIGRFSRYIQKIIGSSSGVLGLPSYETANLLNGLGYRGRQTDAPHSA